MLNSYENYYPLIKNVLFLCYVSSYYLVLLSLISFFLFYNIKKLRYLTELCFYGNYGWLYFLLLTAIATLLGLPPFFLFYAKLSVVAIIILNQTPFLILSTLLVLFYGWFTYLNVLKLLNVQTWSFSAEYDFSARYYNTQLTFIAVSLFYFLTFGFLFYFDLYCYFSWLCL
jgi:hypothetical protein